MHTHRGPARVFEQEEDCIEALLSGRVKEGDVMVIRCEGPKGGPGMREMVMATWLLVDMGLDKSVAIIADGRFSGTSGESVQGRFFRFEISELTLFRIARIRSSAGPLFVR